MIFIDNQTLIECMNKRIKVAQISIRGNNRPLSDLSSGTQFINMPQDYIFKAHIFCTEEYEVPIIKIMIKFWNK